MPIGRKDATSLTPGEIAPGAYPIHNQRPVGYSRRGGRRPNEQQNEAAAPPAIPDDSHIPPEMRGVTAAPPLRRPSMENVEANTIEPQGPTTSPYASLVMSGQASPYASLVMSGQTSPYASLLLPGPTSPYASLAALSMPTSPYHSLVLSHDDNLEVESALSDDIEIGSGLSDEFTLNSSSIPRLKSEAVTVLPQTTSTEGDKSSWKISSVLKNGYMTIALVILVGFCIGVASTSTAFLIVCSSKQGDRGKDDFVPPPNIGLMGAFDQDIPAGPTITSTEPPSPGPTSSPTFRWG